MIIPMNAFTTESMITRAADVIPRETPMTDIMYFAVTLLFLLPFGSIFPKRAVLMMPLIPEIKANNAQTRGKIARRFLVISSIIKATGEKIRIKTGA